MWAHLSCGILAKLVSKFGTENGKEIFALTCFTRSKLGLWDFHIGIKSVSKFLHFCSLLLL